MLEIYIIMFLSFLAPIGIFCCFWKFKKPFWSIAVYLPLLLYSVIENVFLIGRFEGFWLSIKHFVYSDAVLIFYFWWLPSIIGFSFINIIYFAVKTIKNKWQND